ncbi:MAG TPA: P-loop NTPase [Steroidobacteraceae bacterium]|nr:P-loop NTPase [Steroidobacteraceae bacterium]
MSTSAPPVRTISIASGKGGVGKSFLALNLAIALAELGQRVLLVELDADAGALSIAAGLGEPKVHSPAMDAATLASRALSIPGTARVQLLRACDIPASASRSPATLEPLLAGLQASWRIVDLAPGMGPQNVLWMRRGLPSILIGTPELVSVQAMLRLHLQLRRQHAYERLLQLEPRLRGGPASLSAARHRLQELVGATAADQLWNSANASFRSPWWIFNRVLSADEAQLNRITAYLAKHAGSQAAQLRTIPEDAAQAQCARYGRALSITEPASTAAQSVRDLASELLGAKLATHLKRSA